MTATNTTRSWTGRYCAHLTLAEYAGHKDVIVSLYNETLYRNEHETRRILGSLLDGRTDISIRRDDEYIPSTVADTFSASELDEIVEFFALLDDENISISIRPAEVPRATWIGAANRTCGPHGTWFKFADFPQYPERMSFRLAGVTDPEDFERIEQPKACASCGCSAA
ncbi:MAG: hypothetical protein KF708_22490 [Pirellulales bacterium]|nr:hypothetical protein [Pirellulales bacterium]